MLLSIITFLPAVAAAILALFLRGEDEAAQSNAKVFALITTSVTFIVSLFMLFGFDPHDTGFQFVEERPWILGFTYKMGVDGISVLFVMLTTFLMPITIAACWGVTDPRQGIHDRLPAAGNADAGRFHGARSDAVLSVF